MECLKDALSWQLAVDGGTLFHALTILSMKNVSESYRCCAVYCFLLNIICMSMNGGSIKLIKKKQKPKLSERWIILWVFEKQYIQDIVSNWQRVLVWIASSRSIFWTRWGFQIGEAVYKWRHTVFILQPFIALNEYLVGKDLSEWF